MLAIQSFLGPAGLFILAWQGPTRECLAILLLFGPGPAQDQQESVLEVLHRQMGAAIPDQPQHLEKTPSAEAAARRPCPHPAELSRRVHCARCSPGPTPAPQDGLGGVAFLVSQPIAEKVARGKSLGIEELLQTAS